MARKEKEIVWHKRRAKFLPASIEKVKAVSGDGDAPPVAVSRRQQFERDLMIKIREAVKKPPKDKSAS